MIDKKRGQNLHRISLAGRSNIDAAQAIPVSGPATPLIEMCPRVREQLPRFIERLRLKVTTEICPHAMPIRPPEAMGGRAATGGDSPESQTGCGVGAHLTHYCSLKFEICPSPQGCAEREQLRADFEGERGSPTGTRP
jgi:hypothetical protein